MNRESVCELLVVFDSYLIFKNPFEFSLWVSSHPSPSLPLSSFTATCPEGLRLQQGEGEESAHVHLNRPSTTKQLCANMEGDDGVDFWFSMR